MLMLKRDTCSNKLKELLLEKDDQNTLEECNTLMERVIECRHTGVMKRQKARFEALVQWKQGVCSNQGQVSSSQRNRDAEDTIEVNKKRVRKLSSTPLTDDQERLLAQEPKFSIRPRQPAIGEYVAAVEQACSRLNKGEIDETRVEVKKALKRAQCSSRPSPNISKQEYQALKELKEHKGRVILTTDKGVSLVIMDRADTTRRQKSC